MMWRCCGKAILDWSIGVREGGICIKEGSWLKNEGAGGSKLHQEHFLIEKWPCKRPRIASRTLLDWKMTMQETQNCIKDAPWLKNDHARGTKLHQEHFLIEKRVLERVEIASRKVLDWKIRVREGGICIKEGSWLKNEGAGGSKLHQGWFLIEKQGCRRVIIQSRKVLDWKIGVQEGRNSIKGGSWLKNGRTRGS